jgi:hypothetical protein
MEAVAGEYMEEAVPWLAFWNALYPESRLGARVFCLGEKTSRREGSGGLLPEAESRVWIWIRFVEN